jgi:hypothetical protein
VLPQFDADGVLPKGIHVATWAEIAERFGGNPLRRRLLAGLAEALELLQIAGCQRAYLNGSFATSASSPKDFDVCYDIRGMDPMFLDPVFFDFRAGRAAQKAKYGGELFPSSAAAAPGFSMLQFFQVNKETGIPKGIVAIDLQGKK